MNLLDNAFGPIDAMLDNLMPAAAERARERRHRHDELQSECHAKLRDELLHALETDPQAEVMTPGFGRAFTTAAAVIADDLGGDDKALHELLQMLAAAVRGEDIQLRAQLWTSIQANRHAAYHAGDLAIQIEGDDE